MMNTEIRPKLETAAKAAVGVAHSLHEALNYTELSGRDALTNILTVESYLFQVQAILNTLRIERAKERALQEEC